MRKENYYWISFAVDILHSGHINIILKQKYGKVVVGLLSDQAPEYKDLQKLIIGKINKNSVKVLKMFIDS